MQYGEITISTGKTSDHRILCLAPPSPANISHHVVTYESRSLSSLFETIHVW